MRIHCSVALLGVLTAAMLSPLEANAACTYRAFTGDEDNVLRAYISYYGRPADRPGLMYWGNRLHAEGGVLTSIVQAFGVSQEFTDRYGGLTNAQLVTGIYRQLLGRNPEPAGLNYYVGELVAGRRTLQSIALDVLFGAQNDDALVVANRLAAAKHFTSGSESVGFDPANFDGDAMAAVLASVRADPASRDVACGAYAYMLDALGGDFAATMTVTKTSDTNDGVCNADCSLREAVAAANAVGARTRIVVPAGTYAVNAPLDVTGNVHVQGTATDGVIVDAAHHSRIFTLESPLARLVVSRATLANGNSDFGGAVLNKGTLILDRVKLTGNQAYNGGAILNTGTVAALDATFSANKAVTINASTGFGGALNDEGGSYLLFASRLDGNTASFNGGGIYASGPGVIANSVLSSNQSSATGGAIDTTAAVTIVGSTVSGNSGNDGGARAARTASGSILVTTSAFSANVANGTDLGGGGAAFNYQGSLTFIDTTFTDNSAFGEGGGAIETNGALRLTNATFTHNEAKMHNGPLPPDTAPGFGGAILIIAGSSVTIGNATFTNNIGGNSGGAIYNDRNAPLTISGTTFTGNSALGLFAGGGGYGGAVYSEGNLTVTSSTFTGNNADEAGGAIGTNVGTAAVSTSTISGNGATHGAGVVAYSGTLTLTDTAISGNTATMYGGGLLNDAATSTLTRVQLTGNHAQFGGGFSNNNANGHVNLDTANISANTAPDGSVFVNFGTVTVKNSTLSGTCNNHKTVQNLGGNTGCGL